MDDTEHPNPPFVTAATAARELGYAGSTYVSVLCNAGKIPGAYRDGRIWFIPWSWIEEKKQQDTDAGVVRGRNHGRPVTTGAGLNRKRPPYQSNGRPQGRPKKNISENTE